MMHITLAQSVRCQILEEMLLGCQKDVVAARTPFLRRKVVHSAPCCMLLATFICMKLVIASTNSTPSSCGATSSGSSDAPPTPKMLISDSIDQDDLADTATELSSPHTYASTPSTYPNNATTPAGESLVINDGHVEVLENGIIESVLGLRKLKGKESKHDISRVVFGSMFAYIVLGIWVGHKQLLSHHHIIFITIIIFFQVLTSQHSLFAPTRSGQ